MKAGLPPRRLIPRWSQSKLSLHQAEAEFSVRKAVVQQPSLNERFEKVLTDWKSDPTTGVLGDLLSFSVVPNLRQEIADSLATTTIASGLATPSQIEVLEELFGRSIEEDAPEITELQSEFDATSQQSDIARLRRILRVNPRDSIGLVDKAHFELGAGKPLKARRSLAAALQLSPNNRLVIRALSRFHMHQLEHELAHDLVANHPRTENDPWLMASEIALADAADTPSKFLRKGIKFIRESGAESKHLTELAGATGSAFLAFGDIKGARKMFRAALDVANDNVVAQAATHKDFLGADLQSLIATRTRAHEARTLLAWDTLDALVAEEHAKKWHLEEPFSSRPLHFLTTIYATQRQNKQVITLGRRGLVSNPDDPILLANLAYAYASSGELESAALYLRKLVAKNDPKYLAVASATAGLLAMQQQDWNSGIALYDGAMRLFRERRELEMEALCCAYFARSAFDTDYAGKEGVLARAKQLHSKNPTTDGAMVLRLLDQTIEGPAQQVESEGVVRWILDVKTASLIPVKSGEPGPTITVRRN